MYSYTNVARVGVGVKVELPSHPKTGILFPYDETSHETYGQGPRETPRRT
jgi:hypothetical protein